MAKLGILQKVANYLKIHDFENSKSYTLGLYHILTGISTFLLMFHIMYMCKPYIKWLS